MTKDRKYFAADAELNAEQERLSWQEQTLNPVTFRNLEISGITQGWKCLAIGMGYGSVTSWLAERVGLGGKVVATDIRPELHHSSEENIEIRQHNILKDEVEKDHFDLAYCRMVLQHLSEPETALSRMAEAVKPGGWLIVEELDNYMMPKFDSHDPRADYIYRTIGKYQDMVERESLGEMQLGRRLRELFEKMGLEDVGCQGTVLFIRGGEPLAKAMIATWRLGFKLAVDLKLETEEETKKIMNRFEDIFKDPSFYFTFSPLCCAWGRKPE